MTNVDDIQIDDPDQNFILQKTKMHLEAGLIGKLFGTEKNAPINIVGVVAVLLLISGIYTLVYPTKISTLDFWNIIIPAVTMILGFIFGKNT